MDLFDIAVARKLAGGGGGGGASNIVWHTFTPSDANTTHEITLPYDGDGYPIEVVLYSADATVGTSTSYKAIQGLFVKKANASVAPAYTGKNPDDNAKVVEVERYNLTASGRLQMVTTATSRDFFNSNAPSTSTASKVRMTSKNKLNALIAASGTTNGGLMPGVEYTCVVKYSE